jgi:hypothetical protein
MSIFEISGERVVKLEPAGLSAYGLSERADLLRLLRFQVDVVAPDVMVVGEDIGPDETERRVDLLGIDTHANLVVINLERPEDEGRMELHAIRHAAMASKMTFGMVTDVFTEYLEAQGTDDSARDLLLAFLNRDAPNRFPQDVRIVLASAEFSRDTVTSVMWLNEHGLDMRCVRLRPYSGGTRLFIDVQQIIPLPEAAGAPASPRETKTDARKPAPKKEAEAPVAARQEKAEEPVAARQEKAAEPRAAAQQRKAVEKQAAQEVKAEEEPPAPLEKADEDDAAPEETPDAPRAPRELTPWGGLWFVNVGMDDPDDKPVDTAGRGNIRHWDNCVRYGYIAGGGGARSSDALKKLEPGWHVVAYQKGEGYLGYGVVTRRAEPIHRLRVEGSATLAETLKQTEHNPGRPEDRWEYAVGVEWRRTFPLNNGKWFKGGFANQNIVCRLADPDTVSFLRAQFKIPAESLEPASAGVD